MASNQMPNVAQVIERVNVRCEHCGKPYHYEMLRPGRAAPLGETPAPVVVIRAVGTASEIAPCPECQWVQSDMVQQMRRQTAPMLVPLAWVLAGGGALVWIASKMPTFLSADPAPADARAHLISTMALWAVALALILFVFRCWLQSRVDPNADYPAPTYIPGSLKGIPGRASKDLEPTEPADTKAAARTKKRSSPA